MMPPQGEPAAVPSPPPPQVTAIVDRDEFGNPIVAVLVHIGPIRVRLQLDSNNAAALGMMLLGLARDAAAQLVVPNGEGKLITP